MSEVLEMRLKDESTGQIAVIHFIYILTGVCHSHEISESGSRALSCSRSILLTHRMC